jgi:hypothetical protein
LRYFEYRRYIHERFLADPRLKSVHPALQPRLAQVHASTGLALVRLGNRRKALRQFLTAWRVTPCWSALFGVLLCCFPSTLLRRVRRTPVSQNI